MRCVCCNRLLNDYEATQRLVSTGDFADMCGKCLDGLDIPVVGRKDLKPDEYIEDDDNSFIFDEDDADE